MLAKWQTTDEDDKLNSHDFKYERIQGRFSKEDGRSQAGIEMTHVNLIMLAKWQTTDDYKLDTIHDTIHDIIYERIQI